MCKETQQAIVTCYLALQCDTAIYDYTMFIKTFQFLQDIGTRKRKQDNPKYFKYGQSVIERNCKISYILHFDIFKFKLNDRIIEPKL